MLASMKCPAISKTFIFADDAKLAAQLSCALARPGVYLPVCDGPRLQRPDRDAEIIRRHNAAARARTNTAYMAGVSDESFEAMRESLNQHRPVPCHRISSSSDLPALPRPPRKRDPEPLQWGRERIGIGLLKALRASQDIIFDARSSPNESVPSKGGHLVVCEEGEELAQVIAANYAFALDAGLTLIPEVNKEAADALLEFFYTMYDPGSGLSPQQAQEYLRQELLKLSGGISVPAGGSITFVGRRRSGLRIPSIPRRICLIIRIWGFASSMASLRNSRTNLAPAWSCSWIPARRRLRRFKRRSICLDQGGRSSAPIRTAPPTFGTYPR